MVDPAYLSAIQESYDRVAEEYVKVVPDRFAEDALGRGMLAAFAELVRANGRQPVADLGCGPGHVTAHLKSLGVPAFGVDLSAKMVEIARRRFPALRFEVGSMTALDVADGQLGGIVAWWSILHLPRTALPAVFAEFNRTLAAGGSLLVGFHVGDEELRPERAYGHPVAYRTQLLSPDTVADLLHQAGLVVTARLVQEPGEGFNRPQACLLARKLRSGAPAGMVRAYGTRDTPSDRSPTGV
ncbi:class I SAM-dependent methyltransferase [Micromonospora zingiberis]|uniref:Class I SAM-dependent methyltransferase n=1 Tax=Micromonospora zingiberis TaxID=2053011 RepID=A0A4R0G659_9ACTN|nr:class I SAM-dependent methyltransferase [Micromonospora zingiberis]TCB91263.1 class I SAM-dependent methyltransferase [Micromonospora zingiberis]